MLYEVITAALLCEGERNRVAEGLELLRGVEALEDRLATDAIGREHAATPSGRSVTSRKTRTGTPNDSYNFV